MFTVSISVASILVIIMEAQCHEIDDFCDIVPNKQVFRLWHGQAVGVRQHCIMCVLLSKLCAKKPLLGLLMGADWRLPTCVLSEKVEICTCYSNDVRTAT